MSNKSSSRFRAAAFVSTLLAVVSLPVVSGAAVGTLYAITGAGGGGHCGGSLSTLYTIDPATGAATAVAQVKIGGTTAVRNTKSLAVHPQTGVLYAIMNGQQTDCSDDGAGTLLTIDPTTAVATIVGSQGAISNVGFDVQTPDMTFDPLGNLYAWNEFDGDSLWKIDTTTGVGSRVNYGPGTSNTGLAADSKGRMYVKSGGTLYEISPFSVETYSQVFLDTFLQNFLAFDENDVMFSGTRTSTGFDLYTINPATGATTLIGSNSVTNLGAIAFDTGITNTAEADLSLTKEADDLTPVAGSNITFTLTLTNDGPDGADNVVVNDLLPSGYAFVSSSGDGIYDDQTGFWSVETVDANSTASLEITATVLNNQGDYENVAEIVTSDSYDTDSVPGSGGETETFAAEDDYESITPDVIFPKLFSIDRGAPMLWIIDPTGLSGQVAMPIALDGTTIGGGSGLAAQPDTGTLFAALKVDAGRSLATIDPTDGTVTEVGSFGSRNVVSIAFADQTTLYAATGNSGSNQNTLFSVDPTDASMTALCTIPDAYGNALAYSNGTLYLAQEYCTSTCVFQLTAIDTASLPADPADPCGGTVYGDETVYYEPTGLTVETDAGGTVTLLMASFGDFLRITLSGGQMDLGHLLFLSHQSKGLAFTVAEDVTIGQLYPSKTSTKDRVKGSRLITYTIGASNGGEDTVGNVTLTDDLPSGVSFVSGDGACNFDGATVSCDISQLDPGASQSFSFVVEVTCKKCSTIQNNVTVSSTDAIYDYPFDNTSSSFTSVKGKF